MKKLFVVMFCMLVLTLGLTAVEKTGLFPVCYEIGNPIPGAPLFTAKLVVNAPEKTINSFEGRITQTTNPPLDIATDLHGYYFYATVMMPAKTLIVVHLIGYPIAQNVHADPKQIIFPNVYLDMVL
jgi:hypothetical protein